MRMGTDSRGLSRTLEVLGPSWSASPMRRLVQVACLIAFLVLFFYVCWPYGSKPYAETFRAREIIDAELFLILDPLVSISAAIAARVVIWSLAAAGVILLVCLVFPRAFCGYVCPLGTLLDGFDWLVGGRIRSFRPAREGWWSCARYGLLVVVLTAAVCGVLLSGFVAPIPIVTRAMLLVLAPVQTGLLKGWYLVPAANAGHVISIALVALVFCLGLFGRRFWCRYLCPTGALFSALSPLRLTERRVSGDCVKCGRCIRACSFGAVREDFSTRLSRCTFCRSCNGVCPTGAVEFKWRWSRSDSAQDLKRATGDTPVSRRGVVTGLGGAFLGGIGVSAIVAGSSVAQDPSPPIRPPGSVPEDMFLRLCVRCGQCIKVCPNNALQPAGLANGFDNLWTPKLAADWSGCEPSCNNCGQVCPTSAIRALNLPEKQAARMGLAQVDRERCLPYAGRQACQLCLDECKAAGYDAIEFRRIGGQMDENGRPVEGSGRLVPVVVEDRCVGCGLCQMRCHAINVKARGLLPRHAIEVVAGPGREDRITSGSYIALREERAARRRDEQEASRRESDTQDEYLPDFLK